MRASAQRFTRRPNLPRYRHEHGYVGSTTILATNFPEGCGRGDGNSAYASDLNGLAIPAAHGGGDFSRRSFAPNAFLRIGSDNSVTVIAKHVEMGQGAYTGIATVVAEELDADWAQVRVESAPADAKRYGNSVMGGMQGTGGSSAMANSWTQLREAGGKARDMLLARRCHTVACSCGGSDGRQGHHLPLGEQTAGDVRFAGGNGCSVPVPETVKLKDPKDFKLIGHRSRVWMRHAKSNGTAQFTLDFVMPGMLVALLKRAPQFGATVKSFDATAALRCRAWSKSYRYRAASRWSQRIFGRPSWAGTRSGAVGQHERRKAQLLGHHG